MPRTSNSYHFRSSLSLHFVILLAFRLFPALAEKCSICDDSITYPGAMFQYQLSGGGYRWVNCTVGGQLALGGSFTNCTLLRANTEKICCSTPIPKTCPLCGISTILPHPQRVIAGKTCAQWQADADYDFKGKNCDAWQKSMGIYCGCDITDQNFFDGFCRICNSSILPNYNATIKWDNVAVEETYCAVYEQKMNSLSQSQTCEFEQSRLKNSCQCEHDATRETPSDDIFGPQKNSGISYVACQWRLWTGVYASVLMAHMIVCAYAI